MNEQELVQKIDELEKQSNEIFEQKLEYEEELKALRIKNLFENKILSKWAWKYDHETSEKHILIARVKPYPNELKNFMTWEHGTIDLTEDIVLGWYDGTVYLAGPIEDLYYFITENEMTVDFSKLNVPYIESMKEIKRLQELMDMLGVNYD